MLCVFVYSPAQERLPATLCPMLERVPGGRRLAAVSAVRRIRRCAHHVAAPVVVELRRRHADDPAGRAAAVHDIPVRWHRWLCGRQQGGGFAAPVRRQF